MNRLISFLTLFFSITLLSHPNPSIEKYPAEMAHIPTPLPDRVVLTWNDDPATTQAVTWRTDTSIEVGLAQLAIASANGRALKPDEFKAETSYFESDINEAHYHSVTFKNLQPNTLYAYRVGDGVNWTEYYHFKTASSEEDPFSFIYFGDAQNEVKTHWSRVFREAFRDAPRAAFTLHAGDLIDIHNMDSQWGEWHQGPDWVNGTIPVIATPGNHEYQKDSETKRIWTTKDGRNINIDITSLDNNEGVLAVSIEDPEGNEGVMRVSEVGIIIDADKGIETITGFQKDELVNLSLIHI